MHAQRQVLRGARAMGTDRPAVQTQAASNAVSRRCSCLVTRQSTWKVRKDKLSLKLQKRASARSLTPSELGPGDQKRPFQLSCSCLTWPRLGSLGKDTPDLTPQLRESGERAASKHSHSHTRMSFKLELSVVSPPFGKRLTMLSVQTKFRFLG